ncbi:ferrous iron transport protein A [Kineosphaera limosa]|uniref:Putative transcriptional regulator n=1 Tax=Kineosphaera limosa NBRC 100340 TaxID=1184609 RepID=K6WZJ4_9MICO|nr:FeoA family protein [Kineosphaera limosa]NYE00604.1 ferrous iron transport protein A [Kineosphaera limosa]GAB97542.1 putative transcriptional regulator [Kineosphaera limosa NBRC 100340]
MSVLSIRRSGRPRPTAPQTCSLADLRRGQSAVVAAICESCDQDCARRLLDLGFAPGASVEFIRRTPLGDPTVFRVCDYEVALRRDLSALVLTDQPR